jgi:hypothetical protein
VVKWLAIVLLVAACDKDEATTTEATGSATKPTEGSAKEPVVAKESEARKALVDAWKTAGLTVTDMKSSTAFGKNCEAGAVNKVEVVICDLGSADEAKKAEAAGLTWVGGTTGAAWVSGQLVIAVADRKKADINGKTINQLMKSTPK